MIKPSIGRVVWFHEGKTLKTVPGTEGPDPLAAIVVKVWSDRLVNLVVFDANGGPHQRTSITLVQEEDILPTSGRYCEWMPFQKGQAAKTEALEKQVAQEGQ
jgi:hypothetical protein